MPTGQTEGAGEGLRRATRLATRRSLAGAVGAPEPDRAPRGDANVPTDSVLRRLRSRPSMAAGARTDGGSTRMFSQSSTESVSQGAAAAGVGVTTRARASLPLAKARRLTVQPSQQVHHAATASGTLSGSSEVSKPRSRARRLSRVEAGQMTGMGVVRAGPAVIGQRTPFRSAAIESAGSQTVHRGGPSDPFSTAFVRPTFTFETVVTTSSAETTVSTLSDRLISTSRQPLPSGSTSATSSPNISTSTPSRSPVALLANARIAPHVPISVPIESTFRIFDETFTGHAMAVSPSGTATGAFAPGQTGAPPSPVEPPLRTKRKRDASVLDFQERENGTLAYTSPSKREHKRNNAMEDNATSVAVIKVDDVFGPVISSPAKSSSPAASTRDASSSASHSATLTTLVSHASQKSVPMQRTPGRSFGLPDLTNRPTPSSPRLFVSRAQLLKPSPSPARQDDGRLTARVITPADHAAVASPPLEADDSKEGDPAQAPVWSLSIAPSSPAVSAAVSAPTNLILPTLSLFDPDRSGRVELPIIEDDVSMSEAGDTTLASETSQASTATSSRADETARRLANLQSMLSRLQAPKVASAVSSPSSAQTGRVPSTGVPLRTSSSGRRSTFDPSTMPPPPVASNTARRASSIRAGRPLGTSASAPSLHRGPPPPSSTLAASATRRRASLAASTVQPSENGRVAQGSTAANRLSLGSAAGGQPGAQRSARAKSCLKGVVAFVDVRTAEGDDSGMIFVDMLKDLGARVTVRPSSITTHIVYKAGKSTTLDFYRQLPLGRKPHLVGIAWVVQCAELNMRVDEARFKVEELGTTLAPGRGKENADNVSATAQAALGLSGPAKDKASQAAVKRRRSMEPRALAALNNARANLSSANPDDSALKASIAASIERARRKSLQYAPRVGSPLAKRVFVMPDPVEEEAEP